MVLESVGKKGSVLLSSSLEDYLEATYEIIQEKQGVRASDISSRLGVSRASVTEALKTLSSKGFINYGRYDVISLTPLGVVQAENISKKHKILKGFLSDILGVGSKEADETACKIEHVISDDILSRLVGFIKKYEAMIDKNKKEKTN